MAGIPEVAGRLVLVTGAASGIGRATAEAFAAEGARVLAADIDGDGADATARTCHGHSYTVDVADRGAMEALSGHVHEEHGVLDILVNNAGVGVSGRFLDTPLADWDWILGINITGVVHGCHFFGEPMVARGSGHVVNVSSALAYVPTADEPAYCATKAAVLSLSRSLRADWRPRGVGVTVVCPGVVDTAIPARTRFRTGDAEAERREAVELFARRAYPPERVAAEIVRAVRRDRAVANPSPEARAAALLARLVPNRAGAVAARAADRRRAGRPGGILDRWRARSTQSGS